jgi:hypothetical protein
VKISKIVTMTLVAFLLLLLIGSSYALFSPIFSSAASTNSLDKEQVNFGAGYEIFDESATGSVVANGTFTVPTVGSCKFHSVGGVDQVNYSVDIFTGVHEDGVAVVMTCPKAGAKPVLSIDQIYQSMAEPLVHSIASGNKISVSVEYNSATGYVLIREKDVTKGWSGSTDAPETGSTGQGAFWGLLGPYNSILFSFSGLKTSKDAATVGAYTGSLGSFVSLSGYTVFKAAYTDKMNGHILVKTSGLSSSGTSFSFTFAAIS